MKVPTKIIPWLAWYTPFQPYAFSILRISIGLIVAFHGYSRLFLGHKASELAIFVPNLEPRLLGSFELLAGCLLVIGLLARPVAALLAIEWLTITIAAPIPEGKSWLMFGANDHYPAMMTAISIAVILAGSGPLALDRLVPRTSQWEEPKALWLCHLISRLTLGLLYLPPGIDKVFFGGWKRIAAGNIKVLGLDPPELWALGVAGFEISVAVLLIVGLFVRPTAFAILIQLVVILFGIFGNDLRNGLVFWSEKGSEAVIMMIFLAFTLILVGAGRYSLDYLRGREF